jgi:WD40 repeat protein
MADVFISYSRKDVEFARRLANELTKTDRDVWIDWEDIPRAADWLNEIYTGIESADTFVFIVSPNSLRSEVCNYELGHARSQNKRVIPVIYETIDEPTEKAIRQGWEGQAWEAQARENWEGVKHLNWIFFDQPDVFERELAALIKALEQDLDYTRQHTRLLVRAMEWQRSGFRDSLLLTGDAIDEAEHWLQTADAAAKEPMPSTDQQRYIAQSRREENRRRRLLASLIVTAVGALAAVVIAIFLGIIAVRGATTALVAIETQAVIAQSQVDALELAGRANAALNVGQYESGARYAIDSFLTYSNQQADVALQRAYPYLNFWRAIGHHDAVHSAAFSPDGRFIVSGGDDTVVRLWSLDNLRTFPMPVQRYRGQTKRVLTVAFSPDGTRVIAGGEDNNAMLWDTSTGELLMTLSGHTAKVYSALYAPDGTRILTASEDGTYNLWDAESGRLLETVNAHADGVRSAAWSADGRWIVTGGRGNSRQVRLWDAETSELLREFVGFEASITGVAISPDGRSLLTSSDDQTVRLFDIATAQQRWRVNTHVPSARTVAFSPDGRYAVSGGADNAARVWNAGDGSEVVAFSGGHHGAVQSVSFSSDGQWILTSSYDSSLRLWMAPLAGVRHGAERVLFTPKTDSGRPQSMGETWSAAFSPDASWMVTGAQDRSIRLWDTASGAQLGQLEGSADTVRTVAVSPDGLFVAAGGSDRIVRIWEVESRELIFEQQGHDDGLYSVAWSPDGRYLASAGDDRVILIWDIENNIQIRRFEGHRGAIRRVVWSPDGTKLLSVSDDQTARIWDVTTGEVLQTFTAHTAAVWGAAFSPDGREAVTGSYDRLAYRWNIETGEIVQTYRGHAAAVTTLAFSPDGRLLITGSEDYRLRLWDVTSGQTIREFYGHMRPIRSVMFAPDGLSVLSAGAEGSARLWEIDPDWLIEDACARLDFDVVYKIPSVTDEAGEATSVPLTGCALVAAQGLTLTSTSAPTAATAIASPDIALEPLVTWTPSEAVDASPLPVTDTLQFTLTPMLTATPTATEVPVTVVITPFAFETVSPFSTLETPTPSPEITVTPPS